jgi:hypothetical protein
MTVEYAGAVVQKGQSLISLFSPDLVAKAAYFRGTTSDPQASPGGLTSPKPTSDVFSRELTAPQSGVVVERNAYVGQYVAEGEKLLTIVDPSVLWFRFDVYDRQLPWLEIGQKIGVRVPAIPGKVFPAVISFIEPTLNEVTRTMKVRADVANPIVGANSHSHRWLRFGMYAEGRVQAEVPNVLAVPRTAILFPGGTAYAYVARGDGAYERRQVKLGRQGDELWEVLSGLNEGDRVVTAGNVLMDAQAQFNKGGEVQDAAISDLASEEPAEAQKPEDASMNHMANDIAPARPGPDVEPQATPASGREEQHAGAASAPSAPHNLDTNVTMSAADPGGMRPDSTTTSTNRTATRAAYSSARMALKDEMWRNRMALIAAAHERGDTNAAPGPADQLAITPVTARGEKPPAAPAAPKEAMPGVETHTEVRAPQAGSVAPLSMEQRRALEAFVAEAGGVSRALAADELDQFNQQVARLPSVLQLLQKELATQPGWPGLIERLAGSSGEAAPAKDLAQARKWFLPFSTASVELVKQLKKQNPDFAELKIYHCPMAPKPGLWMQAKGPLANPFYGSKMSRCGEEVAP